MSKSRILFVDDEAGVLTAMKRLFRKSDLRVFTATDADEAMRQLEAHDIQIVFSDQRMLGVRGTDFLKQVRQRYPDTVRCILSGYAEMESVVAAINDGYVYRFVAKPWDDAELIAIVQECVELATSIADKKAAMENLAQRAVALEDQQIRQAEVMQLQEALFNSSRDVLERLPVAIAALDSNARVIYANKRFASEFGHLPGSGLGEIAAAPWRQIAEDSAAVKLDVVVDEAPYSAHVARVDIGGQSHTLIATVSA